VVDGLAAEPARRQRQQPPRSGGGHRFIERTGAFEEQLAAVIGLHDVVVVAKGDAVLVADRSQTAKVKKLVERLKAQGHPEATEHRRNYRPGAIIRASTRGRATRSNASWGGRLSLQKHPPCRALGGRARRCGGDAQRQDGDGDENESIYLPIGSMHRLANPGQDRPGADRGSDRQLSWRRRYSAY
jgi:mannose-1-phosphate guanylyltransferase / mannose-6-phosphate isomerase